MNPALRLPVRLRRGAASLGDGPVPLRELARLHGPALHGSLLVLVAAPSALPIPGVGNVLGITLILMAVAIWHGRDWSVLPDRVAGWQLSSLWARRVLRLLATLHAFAGRWSRRRLSGLAELPRRTAMAWVIGLMGAVIFLPIPFGNVLPALAVSLLGLGVAHRDGGAVMLSLLFAVASVAYAVGLVAGAWVWIVAPFRAWLA